MPPRTVVVIGDSMLEVTVAPSEPIRPGADARAQITLGAGGQGANVAVRLARRGLRVRLVTALGADAAGRLVRDAIEAEGVELHARPAERTGAVLCLLSPGGERTMLSDRVGFESVELEAEVSGLVPGADWLHVSGYVLRGSGAPQVAAGLRRAAGGEMRVSLGGGSVPDGAEAEPFFSALRILRPDLLVLARDEAAAVTGAAVTRAALTGADASAVEVAAGIAGLAMVAIVTAGEEGSAVASGGATVALPPATDERPMLDATGAGDAYLAVLVAALSSATANWPPDDEALLRAATTASGAGAAAARVWGAQGRIADEP